jgi:glucosamine-6-phosphate deaminase
LAAARHVAALLRGLLRIKPTVSICVAAAPSQSEFFAALTEEIAIDWSRVIAFPMDEYLGIPASDPRVLRHYFEKHFYGKKRPGQTPFLQPDAADPKAECRRYAALLKRYPLDISCLGIGESCHLAYNDPHVAKFDDPEVVKVVEVDTMSRRQQVHDGTAKRVKDAIRRAYTLTIPSLMGARHVSCVAPGKVKAKAVARTLSEPIGEKCPATILRRHTSAVLFLDADSAAAA